MNVNANNLVPNTYNAIITFTNLSTGQGTQSRTATLTVYPPAIQLTPATNIVASGRQGGPISPSSFSYTLRASSLDYSITNVPNWLTVSSKSGVVTTSGKTITFKIDLNAYLDELRPNTYVNSINLYNTTNNEGNTSRVATLTITPKK
jgi:hypothetical protein